MDVCLSWEEGRGVEERGLSSVEVVLPSSVMESVSASSILG